MVDQIMDNDPVTDGAGKRGGSRRASRPPRASRSKILLLAAAITLCVVAWGYLVKAAIDFGTSARDGESAAWWWLAVASAGAVACLFVGLIMVSRLFGLFGAGRPATESAGPPAPPGGRRAAR